MVVTQARHASEKPGFEFPDRDGYLDRAGCGRLTQLSGQGYGASSSESATTRIPPLPATRADWKSAARDRALLVTIRCRLSRNGGGDDNMVHAK